MTNCPCCSDTGEWVLEVWSWGCYLGNVVLPCPWGCAAEEEEEITVPPLMALEMLRR